MNCLFMDDEMWVANKRSKILNLSNYLRAANQHNTEMQLYRQETSTKSVTTKC